MIKHVQLLIILGMTIFFISGCGSAFNEEADEAVLAVEEAFNETPKETNHKNADIEYYLPFGFEVQEETPSNIILKNGSKTYILFYNPREDLSSEVVLNATLQQREFDVNQTFENDNKLGFFLVKKIDDDMNEVTVGIGGVKVTSEVKTRSLKSEAASMMTIANSIIIK